MEFLQTLQDPEQSMVLRERIANLEESIQSTRENVDILETECDEAEEKGDDENYEKLEE